LVILSLLTGVVCTLQVADIIVYRTYNYGRFPSEVCSQTMCIMKHLDISIEQTYCQTALEQKKLVSCSFEHNIL